MFHIQTLFMYTGQTSSCVIDERVCLYCQHTAERGAIRATLPDIRLALWCTIVYCSPLEVAGNVRQTRAERGRCRWRGRQTERKTGLVTQLDESAARGLIGSMHACSLCFYTCSLHVAGTEQLDVCGAERRRCIWLPTCCSSSPRLSGEIRSRACLSPSFHLPLHTPLSFCLLGPSFSTSPAPHPYPSSGGIFSSLLSIFCLHAAECKA